jgi:hypothetical protein
MRRTSIFSSSRAAILIAGLVTVSSSFSLAANAAAPSCAAITKSAVVADGYTKATSPVITAYNYAKASANAANSLGTTIDFGAQALVVACVSPSDIQKLSIAAQGASKPAMTATQYMAYMVKQSAGAMTKKSVGGVSDYLDLGNGKEDGLGSTAKAAGLRLDAWVAGKFIVLTFSAPATATPPTALLSFIKTTQKVL